MLNNFVAMAVLVCTVGATNIQALSIDSVGVMTHDDPALPTTGFALAFTDPGGFLSATTAASPGNVIFNVNARVSCLRLLDTEEHGSTHIELVASFANGPNLLYDVEKSDFPMRIKLLHMRPLHEAHYG